MHHVDNTVLPPRSGVARSVRRCLLGWVFAPGFQNRAFRELWLTVDSTVPHDRLRSFAAWLLHSCHQPAPEQYQQHEDESNQGVLCNHGK